MTVYTAIFSSLLYALVPSYRKKTVKKRKEDKGAVKSSLTCEYSEEFNTTYLH